MREEKARWEQEREAYTRQRQQQGQPDVYQALRELPYLTGEDAVGMVQALTNEIKNRDQVLYAALSKMKQMEQTLSGLHRTHTDSSFDAYIAKTLADGGHDPGFTELAKELYLSREGDDLHEEFPRILADRIRAIEQAFEAKRNRAVQANRKQPFIPGKGGQAQPSKPLDMKPNLSPAEVAELLWNNLQKSET